MNSFLCNIKYKTLYFGIALLLNYSCDNNQLLYSPDTLTQFSLLPSIDTLKSTQVNTKLLSSHEIVCIDSILVVFNHEENALINVIEMKNDSIIGQFGCLGHASNEFMSFPTSLYWELNDVGEKLLICPDYSKQTTNYINIDKSVKQNSCQIERKIKHKNKGYEYVTFYLGNKKTLMRQGVTYHDARDNLFFPPCFIITEGDNSEKKHTFPSIIKNKVEIVMTSYADVLKLSPDKTKLLQVFNCLDIFNVVDIGKKKKSGFIQTNSYNFEYLQELNNIEEAKNKVTIFNLDTDVTNKYIFFLRAEHTVAEMENGNNTQFYSKLCVFDWEGNPKASYFLDRNLIRIAYSEKMNVLYGLDSEGCIFRFCIDERFR